MSFWIRATGYCHIPGGGSDSRVLRPGEAVAYAPELHDGLVAELVAGRSCPVELLEADGDPSLPPPTDESSFSFADTRGSAGGTLVTDHTGKVLGHEHVGDVRLPDPGRVESEPEPATPAQTAEYEQRVRAMTAAYAEQRGFPVHPPTAQEAIK